MAPEQIRGQQVDVRSDIYGFGLTAYEVLAGHRPFKETHTRERKMQFHLKVVPPRPSNFDNTVPPEMNQFCGARALGSWFQEEIVQRSLC